MKVDFLSQARKLIKQQKQNKHRRAVFICLAGLVAFCTVIALKMYGQAMTYKAQVLECKYQGHTHTDECYAIDENGNPGTEPICGYADYTIHVHNDGCYDANGNLACTLKEHKPHVHTEECYETEKVLVCGEATESNPAAPAEDITGGIETGNETVFDGDTVPQGSAEDGLQSAGEAGNETVFDGDTVPQGPAEDGLENAGEAGNEMIFEEEAAPEGSAEAQAGSGGEALNSVLEGHVHTEDCYKTVKRLVCNELELHTHDNSCYGEECFDEEGNLIEGSRPSCGKIQLEEHVHTEDCYKTVELTPEEVADLNEETKPHVHTDECRDEEGNLTCGYEEETEEAEKEYKCGKEEHIHDEKCYDEEGNLTCETQEHTHSSQCYLTKEEQEKVEKVDRLIAGLPSEKEITQKIGEYEKAGKDEEEAFAEYTMALQIQIQEAYDAYLGLDEALREYVTGANHLSALWETIGTAQLDEPAVVSGNGVPDYAAFLPIGEQPSDGTKNGMVLELLYGDTKSHADKEPDGEKPNYTKDGMKGNFKLYTSNILGNTEIGDITLSLYFPKEYMDPKGISILEFPQDQVKHQISQVTEETRDGKDYYKISITLKDYIPTGALTLPFDMKFKTAEVPADYALKIFGTLERGEGDEKKESNPTAENTYRPKYEDPRITKYVNTNVFENMKNDYTRVSAKVNENGILESSQYVSFWYRLGDDHKLLRAYDTITLRDTLPTYVDSAGKTQYAVFDPGANPGWELDLTTDPQGHTVKRVFKVTELPGWDSENPWKPYEYDNKLMLQIEQAELKLQFPNCKIDEDAGDGFLKKDLKNSVGAVCEPYATPEEPSPLHEQDDRCEDDIIFTLTSQPGAEGSFTKGNSADTVMDTYPTRSGAYRWSLAFKNKSSSNLVNVEVGDDVIDDRLKFQSIVVEKALLDNIKSVEAFTYDSAGGTGETASEETSGETTPGETEKEPGDIYNASEFANTGELSLYQLTIHGSWTLTLNPEKEYKSFVIHFKDGYTVASGGEIKVWPFSTFRSPDVTHFVAGAENDLRNVYKNHAYTAYQEEGYTGKFDPYYFLKSENQFKLIENREKIWVEKEMGNCNNMNYPQKDVNGNLIYGYYDPNRSYGFAYLYIKGALDEDKDYDDLRLIDLLPDALEVYPDSSGNLSLSDGYGDRYIDRYETIDNYHNSGRTALIIHLNVAEMRKTLDASDGDGSKRVYIGPRVRVKPDATPGNFTNDVYLVSEDFDAPPTGHGQQPDSLNIQGRGTDAQIRWSSARGSLQSIAGIYARKYIAKENSNAWSTGELRLKVGDNFQYKLSMMNFETTVHTNLVVYDVLPRIGDRSVNNQAERGSEFTVNLRGPITPPEGYQIYYTASEKVYSQDMASLVNKTDIWTQDVGNWTQADWNQVTAFKFVANDGVEFGSSQLDFIIPVKVMDALTPESEAKLDGKAAQDRETGTAIYLEATNSFGYSTATYSGQNIESNYVKAQISFAGFVAKKTDENGKALPGAEFKLEKKVTESTSSTDGTGQPDGNTQGNEQVKEDTPAQEGANQDQEWKTIEENVKSDNKGKVLFKNLTVGTYRLTETKAPDGYKISTEPITVTITFDDGTMEYTVTAAGLTGSGTGKDPFVVVNETFYELPETGGIGSGLFTMAGTVILMLGTGFLYKKECRKRRA